MVLKKKFFLALLLSISMMPLAAFAQDNATFLSIPKLTVATLPQNLPNVISAVVSMLLYFVGTVAVLFLIIAGFQFILAAGNPDGVQKAKAAALNTVFGLIIIILSSAAVKFILNAVVR
jgi:uncharacterized membrane protein